MSFRDPCWITFRRPVLLTLLCGVAALPGVAGAADLPEAFRDRLHSEPDHQAIDSIDFVLSLSLSRDQARAILPLCGEACRLHTDNYFARADIQPLEIGAYSAFLAEDRLNQGFTPEVERKTARIHHRAIETRETFATDLNTLAEEVWDILTPSQRQIAENYQPNKEAVFAAFASPQERRKAARRWQKAAKEKHQSFRRAAQRGTRPSSWRRAEDPRVLYARKELEAINRATHPRPDNIARYLLTPAAAEPLYAWTGVRAPRVVREAVHCWRFGVKEYPLAQCERDEQILHELRKEINNWNLVNGMHFSREQIEQLVYLAHETERLKAVQRLAEPKHRMHPEELNAVRLRLEWSAEAVLRPGRLDTKVHVPLPDAPARYKLLEIYLASKPIDDDVDLGRLCDLLEGYSGADIKNIAQRAANIPFLDAVAGGEPRKIRLTDVTGVIAETPPSVRPEQLVRHEQFAQQGA